MEDTDVRITLRLPRVVYAALQALAKRENRSINGQIVYLIREVLGISAK